MNYLPEHMSVPVFVPDDPYRWPQYIEVCRTCDGIITRVPHWNRLRLSDEVVERVCLLCWENER